MKRSVWLIVLMMLVSSVHLPLRAQQPEPSVAVTTSQAAQIAIEHVPGRVLKVTTAQKHYRVKILKKSGRVVVVLVSINTGQIIRVIGN